MITYFEIKTFAGFADGIQKLNSMFIELTSKTNLQFIVTPESKYSNWHCPGIDYYQTFGLSKFFSAKSDLKKLKMSAGQFHANIKGKSIQKFLEENEQYDCLFIHIQPSCMFFPPYNNRMLPDHSIYRHVKYVPSFQPFKTNKKKCIFQLRRGDLTNFNSGGGKKTVNRSLPPVSQYLKKLEEIGQVENFEIIIISDGYKRLQVAMNSLSESDKIIAQNILKELDGLPYDKYIGEDPTNTRIAMDCIHYADIIIYNFSALAERMVEMGASNARLIKFK